MNNSQFTGTGHVFRYTFTQYIKTKSYIITLLIMALASIVVFPIMAMKSDKNEEVVNKIEAAYVINETDMEIDEDALNESLAADEKYDRVFMEIYDGDIDELKESITENGEMRVIITVSLDEKSGGFIVNTVYDGASGIDRLNVSDMTDVFTNWFYEYKIEALGLKESVLSKVTDDVWFEVLNANDYKYVTGEAEDTTIDDSGYWIVYAAIFVSYMIIALSGGLISGKIVEEKTNRIVEYLMTTVRPMALITGKILAMILVTFINTAVIAVCGVISAQISKNVFGKTAGELMGNFVSGDALSNFSAVNIVLCVAIILLGIFIYGIIAGLFGASVTKMEELQQGMRGYTMILLVAFLTSYATLMIMNSKGFNSFVYFTMYFPLTSSMVMPGAIFIGEASLAGAFICIALQAVVACLLLWFVSLVYESVIVSNGEVVKFKQMLNLAVQQLKSRSERRKS